MSTTDDNLPPQTSKFFDIIPSNKRSSASPTSRPLIAKKSPPQTDSMINKEEQPDPLEITTEQVPQPEQVDEQVSEPTKDIRDQLEVEPPVDDEPAIEEDTPPPVQTDIEQAEPMEQSQAAETNNESLTDEATPPPVQTDIEQAEPMEQSQAAETNNESETEEGTPPSAQADIEKDLTEQLNEEELLLPAKATPDEPVATDSVVIHSPENSKSLRLRTWLIALLFVIIIVIIGLVLYIFVFKANATITPGTQIFGS
jgi:hypothetical protein